MFKPVLLIVAVLALWAGIHVGKTVWDTTGNQAVGIAVMLVVMLLVFRLFAPLLNRLSGR